MITTGGVNNDIEHNGLVNFASPVQDRVPVLQMGGWWVGEKNPPAKGFEPLSSGL